MGHTGHREEGSDRYGMIEYMKCGPERNFFPDLSTVSRTDLIFFCSPNNPTGYAASKEQLQEMVDFAKRNGSIIVYDSVCTAFISDDNPKPSSKFLAQERYDGVPKVLRSMISMGDRSLLFL